MDRRVRLRTQPRTEIDLERLAVALLGMSALLRQDHRDGDDRADVHDPDDVHEPDRQRSGDPSRSEDEEAAA